MEWALVSRKGGHRGCFRAQSTLLSLASADGPEPAAMIAVELVGGRTAVNQQIKREVRNRSPAQVSPARSLVVC